ncbi:MAG: alanyl-tRNA editing protein, partial [Peptostreptococcaceae bacterium]|nr:alanyl-tRNA editing protein [Peptostreptococcaceae bacterium]
MKTVNMNTSNINTVNINTVNTSTIKLFREDVYMKKFTATVINMGRENEKNVIVLDQTAFFPTGGGQSNDLGTINGFPVLDVYEKSGVIFHIVSDSTNFNAGDVVNCEINWPRRFRNMQRHCGEHILSGMFFKEYGGVNRGFHMGDEYMTIDINLEGNSDFTEINWDMAKNIENLSNKVIWENAPVITRCFETREETSKLPLRKALTVEEDIIVVCIGNVENPSDCVACCGTHPAFAGEVGLIKILKVEINKGMYRIHFKAGEEALLDYQEKHEIITKLNSKFSANTFDLLEKLLIQEEKNKAFRVQLNIFRQLLLKERITETENALAASDGIIVISFEALKVDDLLQIGRSVTDKISKLLLIISYDEATILFFSNGKTVNCGKLVKETAHIYNRKGGGNDTQARAILPKSENIPTYIDLIEKHL